METKFNIPRFTPIAYEFNPETGYFQKSIKQPSTMPCNAMPYELKRERTMADQIKGNAGEILTIREYKKTNKSKKCLTGLQPLKFINWYIGNHYRAKNGEKILSDILFCFYPDNGKMIAFYFSGFHKNNERLREEFANNCIPTLKAEYDL